MGACNLIELVMEVLKSVIRDLQAKESRSTRYKVIYVYNVTADAISYRDSTVY